ncbi:MAG: sporulation initiation inhibitor Soj [Clostridiales bacterium]|nr:sporulation initiation inhibitor Soj [Clostridiales bacterium]
MGKIIAVTNQKGGVGKTTTSINLSACLAEAGKKVLLVDMDPQGNASSGLGVRPDKKSVYEVILSKNTAESATFNTVQQGLRLMPADIRLSGAEIELASLERREYRLRAALESIKQQYDFIIVDCPPSLNLLTINALTAAQSVIVPIQCEYFALEGLTALVNTITRIKHSFNPGLDLEGILLTMYDGRTNLCLQVANEVKKHFRGKVFSTSVPRNVRLGEAPSHGLPINLYDRRSTGAEAYASLAGELIKKNR